MNYQEKSNLLLNETIDCLRNKSVKSTMLERLHLFDEAAKKVAELPQPLQIGEGLYYMFDNASLPIESYDLLLGRIPEEIPSEEEEEFLRKYGEKYGSRPSWASEGGHTTFSWEMLLDRGMGEIISQTKDELEKRVSNNDETDKILYLKGILRVYQAYQRYIIRYAAEAKKKNMNNLGQICENIAYNKPQSFHEAVQLMLIIGHAYSVYPAVNSTLTYGRMDDLLLPFYINDINKGVLTPDDALAILIDFNCKNNLILGRGEHQMSGGSETDTGWFRNPTYDTPQYVVIGGYSNNHNHINNPLTLLFAKSIIPRLENPFFVFRYTKDVSDEVWTLIIDKLRQNSSIMIYNDETEIPAMIHAGIPKHDAVNYTMHGCNWPDIAGKSAVIETARAYLPHKIMQILVDEKNNLKKNYESIEEIYEEFAKSFRNDFKINVERYRNRIKFNETATTKNLCSTDCFFDGVVKNANATYHGAVPYTVMYLLLRFVGTGADIMTALDELVFQKKKYTLQEIITVLSNDFIGYDEILRDCISCSKYGCDDDLADYHAKKLYKTVLDIVDEEKVNEKGETDVIVFAVAITDMGHIGDGRGLMATPDGRRKGAPVSENLSPTAGVGCNGVTSLLKSVSKLPFERIHSGAFNLRARRDWVSGNEGLNRLTALLTAYFNMGGMQIQLSVADTEELKDAQLHPEKYPDLMVRITGYSAVFIDMCKSAQNEIIRRDEQS